MSTTKSASPAAAEPAMTSFSPMVLTDRSVDSEGIQYYSYDAFVNGEETDIDSTEQLYAQAPSYTDSQL